MATYDFIMNICSEFEFQNMVTDIQHNSRIVSWQAIEPIDALIDLTGFSP